MSVRKDKIMSLIKQNIKDHGVKAHVTCAVKNHRSYNVNIKSCSIDLFQNYKETIQNHLDQAELLYMYRERMKGNLERTLQGGDEYIHPKLYFCEDNLDHYFSGKALAFIKDVLASVKYDYEDRSDAMRDYFDVSYYYSLSVGNNKNGFVYSAAA